VAISVLKGPAAFVFCTLKMEAAVSSEMLESSYPTHYMSSGAKIEQITDI